MSDHCNPQDPCGFWGSSDPPDSYNPENSPCYPCPAAGVNAGDVTSGGASYPSHEHTDAGSSAQGIPGAPITDYNPIIRIAATLPPPPNTRLQWNMPICDGPGSWHYDACYVNLNTGVDILDRANKGTTGRTYYAIINRKLCKNTHDFNGDCNSNWIMKPV